jgi:cytoskeleton protein RodZ
MEPEGNETKPGGQGASASERAAGAGLSLGQYLCATREKLGLSREQLTIQARIPAHYVRMMETDDYSLIADQVYLLPFVRRYAAVLGLDTEEIAARFVREAQQSDSSASKLGATVRMASKKRWRPIPTLRTMLFVVAIVAAIVIAYLWLHAPKAPASSPAVAPPKSAPSAASRVRARPQPSLRAAPPAPSSAAPAARKPREQEELSP